MATGNKSVEVPNLIDNETALHDVKTLDDALALLNSAGLSVSDISEYGTGFSVVDKATLVGVPFVALGYKMVKGDFGPMSVIFAVTKENAKVIIVDGSTGIKDQLASFEAAGLPPGGPFKCEKGLSRSDYEYIDDKGNHIPATTFYLSS
jgi:hypothetical protein